MEEGGEEGKGRMCVEKGGAIVYLLKGRCFSNESVYLEVRVEETGIVRIINRSCLGNWSSRQFHHSQNHHFHCFENYCHPVENFF